MGAHLAPSSDLYLYQVRSCYCVIKSWDDKLCSYIHLRAGLGVIFMGKMLTLLAAGSNMTDMSVNVQCHAVQCLPVWDVENVIQLWHLPATADPIFVIGIYVSYVWKIALNRIDNIPWTIDCTTFTQRIWLSACDMNGNVKLMFDDRVAWQNFCQSSVNKQNVDKAWQRQKKRASSLTSSSPINTRWSSAYFDELTTKRD